MEWDAGVFAFLDGLLEGDLHGERMLSPANATLGVMVSASLAVAVIGRSSAQAPRASDPSRDQAGRSPAERPGHRPLGHRGTVGAGNGGARHRHPGRDGLNGLRCRRPNDAGPERGHPARPSHAPAVADGDEGRPEGRAERLPAIAGHIPSSAGAKRASQAGNAGLVSLRRVYALRPHTR